MIKLSYAIFCLLYKSSTDGFISLFWRVQSEFVLCIFDRSVIEGRFGFECPHIVCKLEFLCVSINVFFQFSNENDEYEKNYSVQT